jgi:hypothetical protein
MLACRVAVVMYCLASSMWKFGADGMVSMGVVMV